MHTPVLLYKSGVLWGILLHGHVFLRPDELLKPPWNIS